MFKILCYSGCRTSPTINIVFNFITVCLHRVARSNLRAKWCVYCTKLEPTFKTNDSEKSPRTGEYASNPERKNTPYISGLAGGDFQARHKKKIFFFGGGIFFFFCLRLFPRPRGGSGEEGGRDSNSPNF